MKGCELCGSAARMFCESDQAILCWDCDEKVHSANFLVAKHSRILLCQVCQSPTPWKASGSKLGPTVSICASCFTVHNNNNDDDERNLQVENHMSGDQESHEVGDEAGESKTDQLFDDDHTGGETDGGYDDDEDEDEDYDDEEEEEEEDEDADEDGENQVVPWSGTATSASSLVPPLATSSSSEEEISCAGRNGFSKRIRDSNADLDSDDGIGCSSSADLIGGRLSNEEDGNPLGSFRPWKQPRTSAVVKDDGQQVSRSTAIIESLKRLQRDMVTGEANASGAILGICRLSRDQSR